MAGGFFATEVALPFCDDERGQVNDARRRVEEAILYDVPGSFAGVAGALNARQFKP
jgi:hypothetical protein